MICEFYLIVSRGGEVVARSCRPEKLPSPTVVVPMRVEVPDEWFGPATDRVTVRVAGPVCDGLVVATDQPFVPGDLLVVSPGCEPHARRDYDCNAGWCGGDGSYPRDCTCGGLIHADFDSYDDDGCLVLHTRCDTCGRQVHEVY